ncbi:sulfoxide reductase heme-binding subunit YedZ [Halioglobus maricola]|uniref:Protein-methionine-sulfoxide reductase heme-binding subunit MsrQ n=2 Tax=Halioglobus maricola TaxID=2601894 RepID=A0A5P9NPK3_9GAMM|nr:sulfoxide reductase heme-binding subunit YedZ [Halioglobus maricola]
MLPGSLKLCVFVACLSPLLWLVYAAVQGDLGPDPAEVIIAVSGEWTLRLLGLTLLMSPLRQWLGRPWPIRIRRMLGLFTFFYACLHLLTFAHFFLGWSPAILWEELIERPYITVGFVGWLLMLPLAITSTRGWQRRLGRSWRRLHQLVYPAAVLGCIHLLWQVRSDATEAVVYCAIFALLLGWRARAFLPTQKV